MPLWRSPAHAREKNILFRGAVLASGTFKIIQRNFAGISCWFWLMYRKRSTVFGQSSFVCVCVCVFVCTPCTIFFLPRSFENKQAIIFFRHSVANTKNSALSLFRIFLDDDSEWLCLFYSPALTAYRYNFCACILKRSLRFLEQVRQNKYVCLIPRL